jgi:hypothetical protein
MMMTHTKGCCWQNEGNSSSVLQAVPEPFLLPKKGRNDEVTAKKRFSSALVMIMDGRDNESTYNIQYDSMITHSNNYKH